MNERCTVVELGKIARCDGLQLCALSGYPCKPRGKVVCQQLLVLEDVFSGGSNEGAISVTRVRVAGRISTKSSSAEMKKKKSLCSSGERFLHLTLEG